MQKALVNAGMSILAHGIGKKEWADSNNERSKSFQYDRLGLRIISGHGRRNQRPSSPAIPKESKLLLPPERKIAAKVKCIETEKWNSPYSARHIAIIRAHTLLET